MSDPLEEQVEAIGLDAAALIEDLSKQIQRDGPFSLLTKVRELEPDLPWTGQDHVDLSILIVDRVMSRGLSQTLAEELVKHQQMLIAIRDYMVENGAATGEDSLVAQINEVVGL